ncbi:uncharacterized protein J3R85_021234 [Psidium guajava]|nr:uncharacterized protein J3R85_021234 [Psidium guajava]
MPHKAKRRRISSSSRPQTFSPFARSLALAASASSSSKHDAHESNWRTDASDDGFGKNAQKDKIKQTESSEEESTHSQSSGDGDDDDDEIERVVQADFAFFDPKPSDFHGVKILLQNYLGDDEWDLSGFVDVILGQTTVGTVVKIEGAEDDGLFSAVSALNLDRYKDRRCIIELKEYLLKVCPENDVTSDLRALLNEQAQHTGLLVSQHVMNFPPQLLPPLYDALFDEVSWATEDEPTEELRNSFKFSNYLLVSKIHKLKSGSQKSKRDRNPVRDADIIFSKLEDEIFYKLSSWSFNFPLRSPPVTNNELKNYQVTGLVMALKAEKVKQFREELKSLIDEL